MSRDESRPLSQSLLEVSSEAESDWPLQPAVQTPFDRGEVSAAALNESGLSQEEDLGRDLLNSVAKENSSGFRLALRELMLYVILTAGVLGVGRLVGYHLAAGLVGAATLGLLILWRFSEDVIFSGREIFWWLLLMLYITVGTLAVIQRQGGIPPPTLTF